jgi:hypothetical protein
MLFDLQGKRRRLVQATYLTLAVLMGGGLVLFGVGSGSISGGLFDAITGKSSKSGGNVNSVVAKRIKADERAIKLSPKNTTALADLVRSHYQLATDHSDQTTGQFDDQGKAQLRQAGAAWQRYAAVAKAPDTGLASLMLQAYGALSDAPNATSVAEILANARPSAAAYLQLTTYAARAGQTRKATLAGQKAVDLAPKSQKKLVKQQVQGALASSVTSTSSG